MVTAPPQPRPGPHRPVEASPPRPPGSVRRTTSIDVAWPGGLTGAPVVVLTGRDLVTDDEGRGTVTARWRATGTVEAATGVVLALDGGADDLDDDRADDLDDDRADVRADVLDDDRAVLDDLVGASLRSGFGRRVADVLAADAAQRTLRHALLEDAAGAFLVSGFAPLRAGLLAGDPEASRRRAPHQADICAGWAAGGPVHDALADHGHTVVPRGPVAPRLERDDPDGWHRLAPPARHTVRRRRLLEVASAPGGGHAVHSHFRDSCGGVDEDDEMVMHEYTVDAVVADGRLTGIQVDARVLPWAACPRAVASAAQVEGVAVTDLARRARKELVGVSTCTHLTSTIRLLADVAALVPAVPLPRPTGR